MALTTCPRTGVAISTPRHALTWYVLDRGIDLEDTRWSPQLRTTVPAVRSRRPARGETEVTAAIREPHRPGDSISTNLKVRAWMASEQRRRMMEARQQGSGRSPRVDITTVVCPMQTRIPLLADQGGVQVGAP